MRRRRQKLQAGLAHQAILLAGATGVAQVLLAVVYVLTARQLSPEAYGVVLVAISVGMVAAGVVDFGTNNYWLREAARRSLSPQDLGNRIVLKIFGMALLGAVWIIVCALTAGMRELWTAAIVMMGTGTAQSLQVSLRAAGRGELVSVSILLDRIVALISYSLLVGLHLSAAIALPFAVAIGSGISAITSHALCETYHRPTLRFSSWVNPWAGAGYFGLASIANSLQSLDVPLLSGVAGAHSAGIYGAVSRWTQPMGLLASAFASAAAPIVAQAEGLLPVWKQLRRAIWLPLCALLACVFVVLTAPWVVPAVLGAEYAGSVGVLQILALVSMLSIIAQPLLVALQGQGYDRSVGLILSAAVLIQLAVILFLSAHLGAAGAAMGSLAAQSFILVAFGVALKGIANKSARSYMVQVKKNDG